MFLLSLFTLGTAVAASPQRRTSALAARLGLRALEGPEGGTDILDRPGTGIETRIEPPKMYRVVLYNDPRMGGEVVFEALMRFFRKAQDEAMQILMTAHRGGQASVGVYTREVAETRMKNAVAWSGDKMLELGFRNEMRMEMVPE